MEKTSATKEELQEEIADLKKKITELEKSKSQHRPADMALQASELKFQQIAEDMPALICTFLPDSTLTYVNAAYCKLFSKRPDELVGQKFLDFLPDDATRENVKHQYMSLTPENPVKTYEHKVIVADGMGKTHWHCWTDHAFFKDNGDISHFQSIGQDITESKKAEDALKDSELKYRSYIENAPNGIFIVDENGRYLQVNPAACRITGYSHKELLTMSIPDLVPPDSRETAGNHFRKVVETGYAHGEFTFLHKHNQIRYWTVEAIRLSATRFMGFVQDITERKQAEAESKATLEALHQSEANLEEAQRIARIGSWDWDMISNTVKWSKEMYRIFGIRADEYDGNPESLLKVIHPDDVERLTNTVKSNSLRGDPISIEFRLIHKSGSVHHIFAACRVEFNEDGRPIRNIGTAQDFTERKHAESQREAALDELHESEYFLRTLLNSISIPVFYKDMDGRYLGFNKAFETFFGATKEKLIGKTVFDINPPDLAAIYHARDKELFESGGTQQYESQVKNTLGTMREVIFNKAVFTNSHGEINGQIGTIIDITDRKQVEETLRESEEKYRLLIENTNESVYVLQDGIYKYVNRKCAEVLGFPVAELIGTSVLDYIHPDDRENSINQHVRMLSGEQTSGRADFRVITRQGEERWADVKSVGITWEGKTATLNFATDITGRRKAEEAKSKITSILNETGKIAKVGGWELDLATGIPVWTDETFRIFEIDLTEDAPILPDGLNCYAPASRPIIELAVQRAIEYGEAYDLELELITMKGNHIWVRTNGNPVQENGKTKRISGTIQDITALKRADEEKQVLEERLARAEKMEALGLLAGGVAHDLNNVLGIVVGYAEVLLSEVDKENPLREDVVTIMDGGQRAASIVDDLLTLARRGVVGRKILNINKLINDLKKSKDWEKLLSNNPNIKINTELEPNLLNISGSSVHLVKTLYNLVSNSAEAMTNGGKITIKTSNKYIDKPIHGYDNIHEGDYVILSVSDTGAGISETDLKHIFEPFYTKKVMGRSGTGLGLSVVWGTVKDHQGYIDVESEEGKGTTFTLYFLITREDITADDIAVSLSEYLGKGQSILVVDDVKQQRDLASRMLKSLNYNVASASCGEDAVEYLKDHKIDLLVLDMIMDPGMDGLDTYKSVLKIHPKQKAIIVSGFSESDRVHDALALGAGAYVKKPYVIETLGLAVKKELASKR